MVGRYQVCIEMSILVMHKDPSKLEEVLQVRMKATTLKNGKMKDNVGSIEQFIHTVYAQASQKSWRVFEETTLYASESM